MRRHLAAVVTGVLLAFTGGAFAQSTYPERTVHVINSGGAANNVSRFIGEKLNEAMGQPFVTETVPGAGGILAATRVARSAPDGYTLFMAGEASITTNVALHDKLPYHPLKDFAPITLAVDSVNFLVVHPSVPAKNVQELVALAKAEPGKLNIAHPGIGTSPHMGGQLLRSMAGIDIQQVPYREANAVIPDLISGRISIYFGNISSLLPLVREGKVRVLAVSSLTRVPMFPDLPTVAESGYPGFQATTWVGLLAPAGTPEPIIRKLHQETKRVLNQPDMRTRLTDLGLVIVGNTPDEFTAQIAADIPRKIRILRDSGMKPN
jgi:tripartite-type tricarboxylate transporter receptor subunit TctC